MHRKIYYTNLIFYLIISIYIFFPYVKIENFQSRYLILLFIPNCFFFLKNALIKKDIFFFKLISFFLIFIIIQSVIFQINRLELTSLHFLGSVFFLFYIFFISYFYYDKIVLNLNKIILIFYIFFIFSSLISLINYSPDAPFFCGGIPNFFSFELSKLVNLNGYTDQNIADISNRINDIKISFKEYLFYENSHIGMIAPAVLIYFFYKYKDFNFFFKILSFIFLFLVMVKSSTTLLVGILINFSIFFLFFKNEFNRKTKFFIIVLIMYSFVTLISSSECQKRLGIYPDKFLNSFKNLFVHKPILIDKTNLSEYPTDDKNIIFNKNLNLTNSVFNNSLKIMIYSFKNKILGWGFNRYEEAVESFILENNLNSDLFLYNKKDGSSNFIKIIVEFGIFGIFFYICVFYYFFSTKYDLGKKIFIIPLIMTQSIRGAGYFNGGFILISLILIITLFNYKKINENK